MDLPCVAPFSVRAHLMGEVLQLLDEDNLSLDAWLSEGGYVQNLKKQAVMMQSRSREVSRRFACDRRVAERVRPAARYLGTHFMMSGAKALERRLCLRAAAREWWAFGRVWMAPLPRTLRRLLFVPRAQGAALTGFEALFRRSGCHVALCMRIRVMLTGGACKRPEGGQDFTGYSAVPNLEGLRFFSCVPYDSGIDGEVTSS